MPRSSQANNKTQAHDGSVDAFIATIDAMGRRQDAYALLTLMQEVSGETPRMWGPSIVGFGQYHYTYENGRQGDAFLVGFSPRKANMVVYIMPGFASYADLLDKSVKDMRRKYASSKRSE